MKRTIKKGKITMIITVGIVCFVLALVMSMQFKIVSQTDITSIESMRQDELQTELANWKSKYEEAEAQYEETTAKIEEYQKNDQSNEETQNILTEELEQVNLVLGKTDVQGEGVEITLKDSDNEDVIAINADDILVIVNALKAAGAEAISINEQRIINMSDIVEINQSFIKVNGQRILAPYVIKAIGNSSYLESALIGNGGHLDEMKKIGQDVSVQKESKITINKYSEDLNTKYIQ